jgi:S1-C subfamily serine protease
VPGDVITALNDEQVKNLDDLLSALERYKPGDEVSVTTWRQGQTRKVKAKLGTSSEE